MTANPTLASFSPALLADRATGAAQIETGSKPRWANGLLLAGVMGGLATSLQMLEAHDADRAAGLVRATETERIQNQRAVVPGHRAATLARDNEGVHAGQPRLAIRSQELPDRLARHRARQAEQSALIADLEILTTEPAMVTAKPSGDTAEKNDTAGPLSITSPLHGGSVVKTQFKTPALQRDYAQCWARQRSLRSAGIEALRALARHVVLAARVGAT